MPKRSIKKNIVPTAAGYYHDLDPYSMHPTKKAAEDHRKRLMKTNPANGIRKKSRRPRTPTFYTIMQQGKSIPKRFGHSKQGPHTFPHFAIHDAIINAKRKNRFDILNSVIPGPTTYSKAVDNEIPSGHGKETRARVAKQLYRKNYRSYQALKKRAGNLSPFESIKMAHKANKLIQLHPLGSYAYKGRGASNSATKGKGESRLKPISQQIDLPSSHGLSSTNAVDQRNRSLMDMTRKMNK